jgi:glycosyltransferase involved in cell wall biosynthesis
MKPEISIILPAIRQENWDNLYDSIVMATSRKFELIICGPYPLTDKLQKLQNVKYVKDFGSPTRASAIASLLAEGKLITWITDDALLMPGAMDLAINTLYSMREDEKNVVITKYLEGTNGTQKKHQPDYYYRINGRPGFRPCTYSPHIPDDWWIFNTAIMYRSFFEKLGGLDCNYEHAAMADTDFAIRAQFSGANVIITQILMYDCDHGQADHKPIEIAQLQFDEPLIQSTYRDPQWRSKIKPNISLNNWKNFPTVWERRFSRKE